jgi:hypothetical protein
MPKEIAMLKHALFCLLLVVYCSLSFAETCPSVAAIQQKDFKGWLAYDSDTDLPLAENRFKEFKKNMKDFVLAEWTQQSSHHNAIHCFYQGQSGSVLDAYLAKDNFLPKRKAPHYWYSVTGSLHCAAGMSRCEFEQA